MELTNKVALVTGGTKGIGAATAVALARAGAEVVINGRRDDAEARATREAISALGRRCELLLADCARPEEATRLVADTVKQFGRLDVLVHSAGGPVNGKLLEITPEDWHGAFDTHVHAVFYLCRAAIPQLKPRREGAIILVSSTAGIRGVVTNVAYQAAKGAIPQLTRALAREFADDNVRVNCVAPGVIRTAFHKEMSEAQRKLNLEQRIPLHREGAPEQVASVILELVKNDYLTGETFTIDGGLTMRIA
ncbi:MAG TPA: SDR family NAD(P)-dependent oxidoreductase [Verrucomicrobiota bacterium]|nr:short-chain dehydrogenase [Verrucomicrobiales bacterium]HRI14172.1 SDR family NAD(P)-dependent oxidoreductase [Verrucomicrobiota bacterium]